jgi:hypothetical protein
MRHVMVRYRVSPETAVENEDLIRAVYTELQATEPAGLRYATFRLDDGVTFVHVAQTPDELNPLERIGAFKEFQAGLKDRCVEPPAVSELTLVGSFGIGTRSESRVASDGASS